MISYKSFLSEKQLEPRESDKELSIIFNKKILGVGCQSIVYDLNRNDYVLKVFPLNTIDDPSFQFIRLAYNHQDNPFLPKIKSYKVYRFKELSEEELDYLKDKFDYYGVDTHFNFLMVVVMEKLHRAYSGELLDNLSYIMNHEFTSEYDFIIRMNNKYRQQYTDASIDDNFKKMFRLLNPLLLKYLPDFHLNNWMLRGNQLVLVDPISPKGCTI